MKMATPLQLKWLREFNSNDEIFKVVAKDTLFFKECEKSLTAAQKCQVRQHIKGDRHKANLNLKKKRTASQANLEDFIRGSKKDKFKEVCHELCIALLSANISWNKLTNNCFRSFLEKPLALQLPSDTMLRRVYLKECYEEIIGDIREK